MLERYADAEIRGERQRRYHLRRADALSGGRCSIGHMAKLLAGCAGRLCSGHDLSCGLRTGRIPNLIRRTLASGRSVRGQIASESGGKRAAGGADGTG